VQDKALGYYYGGWLSDSSVPGFQARTPLRSMLIYDMLANSFRNQTGPDNVPRAEGVMIYLPVGDAGFLVYFGGIQVPYKNNTVTVVSPYNFVFEFNTQTDGATYDGMLRTCVINKDRHSN
jgi:hypothetical protein